MLHSAWNSKKPRCDGRSVASFFPVNLTNLLPRLRAVSAIDCTHMRVLGIDCGGAYTGYGVVEMHSGGRLVCLTCGAIKLSPRDPLARRLARIYDELGVLILEHRPDEVAIEGIFYALNVKSALKLGQVRGVAMLAAAAAGLEVAEYSPLTIK